MGDGGHTDFTDSTDFLSATAARHGKQHLCNLCNQCDFLFPSIRYLCHVTDLSVAKVGFYFKSAFTWAITGGIWFRCQGQ